MCVDSQIFMTWWLCNDLWQMDLYFYSAFSSLLNVFCNTWHIYPFTHTVTHWWQRLLCKVPSAHQEQCGVQRHFNMQPGEPGIHTSHLPITGQTSLLPVNVLGAAPLMYYPPVCCLVIPIQSLKAFQKITNWQFINHQTAPDSFLPRNYLHFCRLLQDFLISEVNCETPLHF